ncbi:MAG TPA: CoA-binding protein [Roseiflexaceae bacterium]|nr:CoA-binding protein [Roseiflexaceae bacterium]HMP40710.1 CoA-binding protein [Roseiflexaceae bacterium]
MTDDELRALLQRVRTIAVVGLSANPYRDSHSVAAYMQRHGYRIIPVNPNLRGPVLGEQPYAGLQDVAESIDLVNIFRRSEYVAEVVDTAIARQAGGIWMQLGVFSAPAAERAAAAGVPIIMNRCIAVEHRRLL